MHKQRWRRTARAVALVLLAVAAIPNGWVETASAQNLINKNGPVMQSTLRVFFIYWTPAGVVLDTAPADGIGNYVTLLQRFAADASRSGYLNIVTQYPGVCSGSPCVLRNGVNAFELGGSWTDTAAYPGGRGTRANPLQDADIRDEVNRAIAQNRWTVDDNSIYFVITGVFQATGALVEECAGAGCTFSAFCAYHDHFDSGGHNIRYSYLSNASFNTAGCTEGISTGVNGQLASDREVVLMSHELLEAITDPELNTWVDDSASEIGDKCNQIAATVAMNGNSYNVQQQWSNASAACVSSFGPSIKFTVSTGGDDLRGNSSVTAALQSSSSATFQTFELKAQKDSGWGGNTAHIAVGPFSQPSAASLGRVAFSLTSHNGPLESNDDWDIQSMFVEVLDSSGLALCTQNLSGNPLSRLGGANGTASFDTPNCLPSPPLAEGVECHVFDDGYTNMSVAAGAVFINAAHQACIADGTAAGTCRKWFGRCATVTDNRSVSFSAFDDGYANLAGASDAIFINGQAQACIPSGTASGICRKWFGRAQTNDGLNVLCTVFDDGASNRSLPSDAVFINSSRQACIPDSTSQGRCSRWWGLCSTETAATGIPSDNPALTFAAPGSVQVGTQGTVTVTAQNTGTSTWQASYALALGRTGRIALPQNTVAIGGTVGPGQSRTLSFAVQCNSQGFGGFSAQMSGSSGQFGQSVGQNILCQP